MDFPGNFILHNTFDVTALKAKALEQTEAQWNEDVSRQQRYSTPHGKTNTIYFVFDKDFRHTNPTYQPRFNDFESLLEPIFDAFKTTFPNLIVIRCILIRLEAASVITPHCDYGFSLMNSHRVHIPIITHDEVEFSVGGEVKHMKQGEAWEINNARVHSVVNKGPYRVHLVIDWAENVTA